MAPKDIPDGFRRVAAESEVPPGQLLEVFVDDLAIALANVDGQIHAIDNTCPHAGGPIGDGTVRGTSAVCPYHGWAFDLSTGICELNEAVSVTVYEVAQLEGQVCVKL
jgi:nitrite reductase/ring-hydroxylating ferredoxin subunit